MQSIGIGFPFTETNQGGIIGVTQTDIQSTRANLVAFMTLKRGQRPMNNSLYSPLYDYIMEQWDDISQANLDSDLKQKLQEFFPEINVIKIDYTFDEANHLLTVKLSYSIIDLKVNDNVSVTVVLQS